LLQNFGLYTPPRIPALPFKRRALLADSTQIGIIGSDDRTRVSAKNRFPYSAVVDIVFSADGVTSGCTASFIGPDILLTSAHVSERHNHVLGLFIGIAFYFYGLFDFYKPAAMKAFLSKRLGFACSFPHAAGVIC
jgi:V8-like Glu-specific endopeptidase